MVLVGIKQLSETLAFFIDGISHKEEFRLSLLIGHESNSKQKNISLIDYSPRA